ncbi:hypothetical protein GGI15_004521 [Coemansia interrupta]|uniref:C2H2-type domain-containing protein n=1 Tax=Coemansia interrupta TaxID=1126814 RepID=A0A9W8H9F1_9FUNG|nr:hypothetical protein GGI15_004521 [Coemansia interrupta]
MTESLLSLFEYRFYESEIRPQKDAAISKANQTLRPQHQQQQQKMAGSLSSSSTGLVNPAEYASLAAKNQSSESAQNIQDLYCEVCKKKFTNDATFSAHKKSEKHKKAVRASKGPSARSSNVLLNVAEEQSTVISRALASMEKAQTLKQKDPAVAATVLWNIAQDIARYRDDAVTKSALEGVLECMQVMDRDPSLRGTKGTSTFWSPRSLLKTTLDCTMAIARIEINANRTAAASRYEAGLCQFLGIDQKVFDSLANARDVSTLAKQAVQMVESIPRRFTKDEDIDQAVSAMKEVAGALVVCADGKAGSTSAWRGVATYFIVHAFAQFKGRSDTAYAVVLCIADVLRYFDMEHLAHDCAGLIIAYHIGQPDSKIHIAAAIVESISSNDVLRARDLIDAYNLQTNELWSVYIAKFIERTIEADANWMHTDALGEWQKVKLSTDIPSKDIATLVDAMLQQKLSTYA